MFPAIGKGKLALGVRNDGLIQVFQSGRSEPITHFGPLPSGPTTGSHKGFSRDRWRYDRSIVFCPAEGYALMIPTSNDRIVYREFNLPKLMQMSGVDYLLLTSETNHSLVRGRLWQHQLTAMSKSGQIRYKLIEKPGGMLINNTGQIRWVAPFSHPVGTKTVRVRLTNDQGETNDYTLNLSIQ